MIAHAASDGQEVGAGRERACRPAELAARYDPRIVPTSVRPPRPLRGAIGDLWERAWRERSSPRELGWSFGVGAFVGCTPLVGLHLWVALGLATVLRLNRLWAVLGSRLSSTPILLATAFSEIQVAHRLRTGAWVPLELPHAIAAGREMLLDWCLGSILVGGFVAVVAGLGAYATARAVATRASRRLSPPR